MDWAVNVNNPGQVAAADGFLGWLLATDTQGNKHANFRRLGIVVVIWNSQVFESYGDDPSWQPYTGSNPHTDHIHFSLSSPGCGQRRGGAGCPAQATAVVAAHWRGLGCETSPSWGL